MLTFIWFWMNPETEIVWKIYAVASSLGEARRNVLRPRGEISLTPEVRHFIEMTSPMIFKTPFVEINVAQRGEKPHSYVIAGDVFGG